MTENVQFAYSLVRKNLLSLMTENKDYLLKRYSGRKRKEIDNLEAVRDKMIGPELHN